MADNNDIVDALESLALHCRPPLMSVDDKSKWMRDWCEDLKSFDIAAIRAATAKWRHGQVQKFPTPGQLLPLVRTALPSRSEQREKPQAWHPITDAEYDQLSLTDKIRHQRESASEANAQAALLWRKLPETKAGKPPSWIDWQSSLAADWARLRSQEVNHLYESNRLKKKLAGFQETA